MNIVRHLNHCLPGSRYFEAPSREGSAARELAASLPEPSDGWEVVSNREWVVLTPPAAVLPAQGWKVHVSATLPNAEHVLRVTWDYCLANALTFKHIRNQAVLTRRNSKYGDRSASGKFITIYPVDDAQLETVLRELGDLLDGQDGPYILSDLRWRRGPLYVRYGGFALMTTRDEAGELVHCIKDPQGRLVPDRRGPGFRPPEWVALPSCLAEAVQVRNGGTLKDFPYRATQALHFSNGGGVYRGVDTRTGAEVLLREARPFAGLDGDGRDAPARLEREHWALQQLQGVPGIPQLLGHRLGNEHFFLIREFVQGAPLNQETSRRNPLLRGSTAPEEYEAYTTWALAVLAHITRTVTAMHERGVVFGDLHPGNILVAPDGTVSLIDFETATSTDDGAAQTMGAAGYSAPAGTRGAALDRYAQGCLRLAVFLPLTGVIAWSPEKREQLLGLVLEHFPVPAGFADEVRADLAAGLLDPEDAGTPRPVSWRPPSTANWPALRDALVAGILDAADPEREDRLYPGDAEQFFTPEGGVAVAHGAAGVLWALSECGVEVPQAHVDWLERAALRLVDPQPGLFTGAHGIAAVLSRLGRTDTAAEMADRADAIPLDVLPAGLSGGLAGIGLAHLAAAQATGDARHVDAARQVADALAQRAGAPPGRNARPGLLQGPAGVALFWLRLHALTGEPGHLDQAERSLREDLAIIRWNPEELVGDQPMARLPWLDAGCGGTGMVLHELVAVRPHPDLIGARDGIRDAAKACFSLGPALFDGRAGAVLALLHMNDGRDGAQGALRRHADGFGIHLLRREGRVDVLGRESLRISTDLATGAAGVLMAMEACLGDRLPRLPVL